MLSLLALLAPALAGGLDQLEVGGAFGTPAATDPTALWWNPAGIAAGKGTRVHLEGAPTLATITYDRVDEYGYGGHDEYVLRGVLPFLGVVTDFGIDNLGVGAAVAVPSVRGGHVVDEIVPLDQFREDGPVPPGASVGRYHLREGSQQALYVILGGGYEIADRVAIGVTGAFVDSTWVARADTELVTQLDHAIADLGQDSGYTDDMIEDPRYGATLEFSPLKARTFTFGAGVRAVVIPDKLVVSVAYNHSANLDHRGDLTLRFACPPSDDTFGNFGAQAYGTCYEQISAHAGIGYRLPGRLGGSVLVQPVDGLKVEAFGGWVDWSVYDDFDVTIEDSAELNDFDNPDTSELIDQRRLWARAARDSGYFGLDVKGTVARDWTFGGRVMYDLAAVPSFAMSPNNQDFNTLKLGAMAAWRPVDVFEFGLSFTQDILQTRVVTDSKFAVTLDTPPIRTPETDRFFYPQSNGTYGGSISRIGVFVRFLIGERTKTVPGTAEDGESGSRFEPRSGPTALPEIDTEPAPAPAPEPDDSDEIEDLDE